MGHNKGWEEAASMFSGDSVVLKTCNAALLEASGKSWVEVSITLLDEDTKVFCFSYIVCIFSRFTEFQRMVCRLFLLLVLGDGSFMEL